MDQARKLNTDIGFAKWWILELMDDPLLNAEQIRWMEEALKKLEEQVLRWELSGFDNGKRHSFHAYTINQN